MPSANKVILIGNVTRDPEIRYTPKGTAVTEIGLAINRTFTVDGERREDTTFVDVTIWGRQAEIVEKYVGKGKPLYVEGRLQLDTWDDKATGDKRSKLRVVCEQLQLLGASGGDRGGDKGGQEAEEYGGGGYQGGQPQGQPQGGGSSPQQAPRQASHPSDSQGHPAESAPAWSAPTGGSAAAAGSITDGIDDDDIPF